MTLQPKFARQFSAPIQEVIEVPNVTGQYLLERSGERAPFNLIEPVFDGALHSPTERGYLSEPGAILFTKSSELAKLLAQHRRPQHFESLLQLFPIPRGRISYRKIDVSGL